MPTLRSELFWCGVLVLGACLGGGLFCPKIEAADLLLGPDGGLMIQPSSQYFHAVYGGQLALVGKDDAWLLSTRYLERPPFRAEGFCDQEKAAFLVGGKKLAGWQSLRLVGALGFGKVAGSLVKESNGDRRAYTLTGLAGQVELRLRYASFVASFSHLTFAGFDGREQAKAFVVWPFNFFLISWGAAL